LSSFHLEIDVCFLFMGRPRRTPDGAKPTTISLTLRQQIAFQELQVKRQKESKDKPTLTEVMSEGFQLVLRSEDWPQTELGAIFPKQKLSRATVRVISKRRRPRT
jgi:hypothetical protein